uniref:Uncharacterized protein n=1 Tax=Rhizophora mucronata TaxID=61149 RepID=A0A2P2R5D3_RHIMU
MFTNTYTDSMYKNSVELYGNSVDWRDGNQKLAKEERTIKIIIDTVLCSHFKISIIKLLSN